MHGNTSKYIITICLNYIYGIHYRYANSNAYFVMFLIPGDNPFVMQGVNSIYELVGLVF